MKYLFLCWWPLWVVAACQPPTFRLEGQLSENHQSKSLNIHVPGTPDDSIFATLPTGGAFTLTLPVTQPKVLEITSKNNILFPFLLEEGSYNLTEKEGNFSISAPASSLQEKFSHFLHESNERDRTYNQLCSGYDTISDIHRKAEHSALLSRQFAENENFRLKGIRQFTGTEIAQYIIYRVLYFYEYNYSSFSQAMEALGDSIPESGMKHPILNAYKRLKAAQLTGKAPAFTLQDTKGEKVSLDDYKGKYVLIDFWASWCAPCRVKNKELNKHYPELKKQGLEVISISMDDNKQQWLKAVKEDKVSWIQLNDPAGFKNSEVRKNYKVNQVPTVYLISPSGEILTTNPTEEEIITFLNKPAL